jgi:hypothetical protein
MRRVLPAITFVALLFGCGSAAFGLPQSGQAPNVDPNHATGQSSSGASSGAHQLQTLQIELTHTIRAKKAKAGDVVKARTVTALIMPGQVVIPEGSKVAGHVVNGSSGAAGQNVEIAFDRFELKNRQRLPANFSIRSGAMRAQPIQQALAVDEIDEAGPPPSAPSSHNTQKPTHMTMGGFTNSTKPRSSQQPTSTSPSLQPTIPALGGDNRGDMRALAKGSLSGMPGVALRLDEVSGGATFESSNRKLELKTGLQLMLSVEPVPGHDVIAGVSKKE